MKRALFVIVVAAAGTGCPGKGGNIPAPGKTPSAAEVLTKLAEVRAQRASFSGESVMDYWLGNQRVKGTVLVMGTSQKQVRFNALSPQGGGVIADLACNGNDFTYVDFQNNCQLTGPCNASSIAALLRVQLEPDDFLRLAVGMPPVPPEPRNATGEVTWDAKAGFWRAKLATPEGTQTIAIDAREGRYDVVASELVASDGTSVWSLENTEFDSVADAAGGSQRLPMKTRFKAPARDGAEASDVIVEWKERTLNVVLDPAKFVVTATAGLPPCGASRPATP